MMPRPRLVLPRSVVASTVAGAAVSRSMAQPVPASGERMPTKTAEDAATGACAVASKATPDARDRHRAAASDETERCRHRRRDGSFEARSESGARPQFRRSGDPTGGAARESRGGVEPPPAGLQPAALPLDHRDESVLRRRARENNPRAGRPTRSATVLACRRRPLRGASESTRAASHGGHHTRGLGRAATSAGLDLRRGSRHARQPWAGALCTLRRVWRNRVTGRPGAGQRALLAIAALTTSSGSPPARGHPSGSRERAPGTRSS